MEDKRQPENGKKGLKNSKAFWAVIYVLIAAMLLGGIYMVVREYIWIPGPYVPPPTPAPTVAPTPAPTLAPSATPLPTPSPTPYVQKIPTRIYFTNYERQADIFPVGVDEDNRMGTLNSAKDSAWYQFGPSPGEPGNAILNGHVKWKGELGTFSILKEMKVGDEVVIEYDDSSFKYFDVTNLDTYLLDEIPASVMDLAGESRMTLITCLGDYDTSIGTSRSRVVAVCKERGVASVTAAPSASAAPSAIAD